MSMRMYNPVLTNVEGLGAGPNQRVANIIDGAQNGVGTHVPYIDGSQPLVANPVQIVVLTYPGLWDLPGYEYNPAVLKALLERHATGVSGIDFGYTLNTDEFKMGHDGQSFPVPLNTVRGSVSPSFTLPELKGNLVFNFFKRWLWDINMPDTNASFISSLLENEEDMPEWVHSTYGMSMMAIQYDETGLWQNILGGAVYLMFPVDAGGDIGYERQLGQTKTITRTVNFKGYVQHNANTDEFARYVGRSLSLHKANYNVATTETGINLNLKTMGLDAEQQRILNEFKLQSDTSAVYSFGSGGTGNGTSNVLAGQVATDYSVTSQRRDGTSGSTILSPTQQND